MICQIQRLLVLFRAKEDVFIAQVQRAIKLLLIPLIDLIFEVYQGKHLIFKIHPSKWTFLEP